MNRKDVIACCVIASLASPLAYAESVVEPLTTMESVQNSFNTTLMVALAKGKTMLKLSESQSALFNEYFQSIKKLEAYRDSVRTSASRPVTTLLPRELLQNDMEPTKRLFDLQAKSLKARDLFSQSLSAEQKSTLDIIEATALLRPHFFKKPEDRKRHRATIQKSSSFHYGESV